MGYRYANTVLLLLPDSALKADSRIAANECGLDIWEADCATDLIGAPYFLAIVDPTLVSEHEWADFCEYLKDSTDTDTKVMLSAHTSTTNVLPGPNRLKQCNTDVATLKFTMLRLRAIVAKRRASYERVESRIVRIMWMARELQSAGGLRLRDAAKEFQTSVRTIQRDIEVLEMAGYMIFDGHERGTYLMDSGQVGG